MFRTLNREEKATLLGVDIGGAGNRTKPLGRIEQTEHGTWKWLLTRYDDEVEHRLMLVTENPETFKAWLHAGHLDLLKCKPFRTVLSRDSITTAEWARIAQEANGTTFEGIEVISYFATPLVKVARAGSRWVSVADAADRLQMSQDGVRRRIRLGQLNARRVRFGSQFYYQVNMSNEPVQAEIPMAIEPLLAPLAPAVEPVVEPTRTQRLR